MFKLLTSLTSFIGILTSIFFKKKYDLEKERVNDLKIMLNNTNEAIKFKQNSKITNESSADEYLNRLRASREGNKR